MVINIPTFSIWRPTKFYQNWNFWFENEPSGNPADRPHFLLLNFQFFHPWFAISLFYWLLRAEKIESFVRRKEERKKKFVSITKSTFFSRWTRTQKGGSGKVVADRAACTILRSGSLVRFANKNIFFYH
jgi:hypothetical protein